MILLNYDERETSEDVMIMRSQRMGVKRVPLSLSLMILFAAYAGPVSAAPGPSITSKRVSGVVSVGEWQSANQSEKVVLLENGKRQVFSEKAPNMWFVILKGVDGLSEKECRLITNFYGMRYPHHELIVEAREDGKLVLVFRGDLDLPIKIGSKIAFEGFLFKGDDYGGAMTYHSFSVDGKRYLSPDKKRETPQ